MLIVAEDIMNVVSQIFKHVLFKEIKQASKNKLSAWGEINEKNEDFLVYKNVISLCRWATIERILTYDYLIEIIRS